MTTYRDLFKWGDKREQALDTGTLQVIRRRFGWDASQQAPHLPGHDKVSLDKPSGLTEGQLQSLHDLCGAENVAIDDAIRASHAHGKFYSELLHLRMGHIATPPDAVVYPRSEEEVQALVQFCHTEQLPLTPVGAQSSVTRGVETPRGGISLDLTRHLNQVLAVSETNTSVTVQAGMMGPALEEYLNGFSTGYTCGHFPQSFEYSTVGGWIAARGAGQASTGYGKIEHLVLSLKVVTPQGTLATRDYPAAAQGINLNEVFLGAEGTLGVITQATLKIRHYRPKHTAFASFVFKDFESAVTAMREGIQGGFGLPHLFRISDPEETDIAFQTKGFENSTGDKVLKALGYKSGRRCLMFMSVEGDKAYTRLVKRKMTRVAKRHGAFAIGARPTKKWLEQRYSSAYLRDPLMDAGIMTDTLETAVTWEHLIPLWQAVHQYLKTRDKTVAMTHISHVYENGANLYFTFLSPMEKGRELEDYKEYHRGIIDTLQAHGGSLSHHHGVGRSLAPWMLHEHGTLNMELMQAIKNHLDPHGVMNPGGTLGLKP